MVVGHGLPPGDAQLVAAMLSLPHERRYGPLTMAPRLVKEETIRVLVDIVKAAALAQPCLLLFEDVHWADPTTVETLGLLVERLGDIPLLVVLDAPAGVRAAVVGVRQRDRAASTSPGWRRRRAGELGDEPDGRQGAAGRPGRADHRQDRRRAALHRGDGRTRCGCKILRRPDRPGGPLRLRPSVHQACPSPRRCAIR